MPAAKNAYVDFLLDQLRPIGDITARAMFGGHTLYCSGIPFALVARNEMYLKVDEANRGMFDARGLKAFKPYEDRDETMSYCQTPPEVFEDADEMERWCRPAIQAGERAQAKKKGRKK